MSSSKQVGTANIWDSAARCGIHDLPDEIIGEILLNLPSEEGPEYPIKLGSISSRIRNVAIGMPVLWTQISTEFHSNLVELLLLRSGERPLRILVGCKEGYKRRFRDYEEAVFTLLQKCSSRWEQLDLLDESAFNELSRYCPVLDMKQLRIFRVRWASFGLVPRGWAMPGLIEVVMDERVSTHFPLPDSVEKCILEFPPYSSYPLAAIRKRLGSVCRSPAMKALTLSFDRYIPSKGLVTQQILPYLTSLTVEICLDDALSVLALVYLPNLTELVVSVFTDPGALTTRALKSGMDVWRDSVVSYPQLRRFRFTHRQDQRSRIRGIEEERYKFLDIFLGKAPKLTSMVVDALFLSPPAYAFAAFKHGVNPFLDGPPLEEIEIKYRTLASYTYLQGLVQALRAGPNWEHFRRLKIARPKRISWGGVVEEVLDEAAFTTLKGLLEGRILCWLD